MYHVPDNLSLLAPQVPGHCTAIIFTWATDSAPQPSSVSNWVGLKMMLVYSEMVYLVSPWVVAIYLGHKWAVLGCGGKHKKGSGRKLNQTRKN